MHRSTNGRRTMGSPKVTCRSATRSFQFRLSCIEANWPRSLPMRILCGIPVAPDTRDTMAVNTPRGSTFLPPNSLIVAPRVLIHSLGGGLPKHFRRPAHSLSEVLHEVRDPLQPRHSVHLVLHEAVRDVYHPGPMDLLLPHPGPPEKDPLAGARQELVLLRVREVYCVHLGQPEPGVRRIGHEFGHRGRPLGIYGQVHQALRPVHTGGGGLQGPRKAQKEDPILSYSRHLIRPPEIVPYPQFPYEGLPGHLKFRLHVRIVRVAHFRALLPSGLSRKVHDAPRYVLAGVKRVEVVIIQHLLVPQDRVHVPVAAESLSQSGSELRPPQEHGVGHVPQCRQHESRPGFRGNPVLLLRHLRPLSRSFYPTFRPSFYGSALRPLQMRRPPDRRGRLY